MRYPALLPVLALLLVAAAPDKPANTAPDQEIEHTVKAGETLSGIASRSEVPRVLIIEANGLKPPYTVRTGQKLKIPRTRRHTLTPRRRIQARGLAGNGAGDGNGDNIVYRYDYFADETTNKDKANLNTHNPNPGGLVDWTTDVNGDAIPDAQERPVDVALPNTCADLTDDAWVTPAGIGPAVIPCGS